METRKVFLRLAEKVGDKLLEISTKLSLRRKRVVTIQEVVKEALLKRLDEYERDGEWGGE